MCHPTGARIRIALSATMALSVAASESWSQDIFTGNQMGPECARNSELCPSWVAGMHIMHNMMVGLKRPPLYCQPAGVINSQVVQILSGLSAKQSRKASPLD